MDISNCEKFTGDTNRLESGTDVIWERLSEKDRLIIAIQKLWSIRAYLYTVQTTTTTTDIKVADDYEAASDPVRAIIAKLEIELFNVKELKQKYYAAMSHDRATD